MEQYSIIGIDLAKTKFHIAALNPERELALSRAITREDFFTKVNELFPGKQTFAFEACGGAHYTAQKLRNNPNYTVIMLKPKDVRAYAKSRQKNDANDAIAICRAALDPTLMHVHPKEIIEQEIAFLHKTRQNIIQARVQMSNSLMTSLQEFGYIAKCGKAKFASICDKHVQLALQEGFINECIAEEMNSDCGDIEKLLSREKAIDKIIAKKNSESEEAQLLLSIPGIGEINASILANKPMNQYESAKDFSASLGLVPKQNTTGGDIKLGSITKQGDRYARTMLIQAGRAVLMRTYKENCPQSAIYEFAKRLKQQGKHFNLVAVAIANKLARIAYACVMNNRAYGIKTAIPMIET